MSTTLGAGASTLKIGIDLTLKRRRKKNCYGRTHGVDPALGELDPSPNDNGKEFFDEVPMAKGE